jgi:hypothetical protein
MGFVCRGTVHHTQRWTELTSRDRSLSPYHDSGSAYRKIIHQEAAGMSGRPEVLFEGYTQNEILALSKDVIESMILTGEPVIFRAGSATILGEFRVDGRRLRIELAQIDGGGEGVLLSLGALARRFAQFWNGGGLWSPRCPLSARHIICWSRSGSILYSICHRSRSICRTTSRIRHARPLR